MTGWTKEVYVTETRKEKTKKCSGKCKICEVHFDRLMCDMDSLKVLKVVVDVEAENENGTAVAVPGAAGAKSGGGSSGSSEQ